jgi:hypothetical protein
MLVLPVAHRLAGSLILAATVILTLRVVNGRAEPHPISVGHATPAPPGSLS